MKSCQGPTTRRSSNNHSRASQFEKTLWIRKKNERRETVDHRTNRQREQLRLRRLSGSCRSRWLSARSHQQTSERLIVTVCECLRFHWKQVWAVSGLLKCHLLFLPGYFVVVLCCMLDVSRSRTDPQLLGRGYLGKRRSLAPALSSCL